MNFGNFRCPVQVIGRDADCRFYLIPLIALDSMFFGRLYLKLYFESLKLIDLQGYKDQYLNCGCL